MKKIAIVGWAIGPNSVGITNTYFDFIQSIGGEVVIINISMSDETVQKLAEEVDLLILPGGADLSPHLYGRRPHIFNSNPDFHKEHFFVNHLDRFVKTGTPIFGICLGLQMLNVHFGGTLTQHVNALHTSDRRYSAAHKVLILNPRSKMDVNSHHHQAVKLKDMSPEFNALSFSDEYDKDFPAKINDRNVIVESFIHKTLPIAGVQWHPEEWFDEHSIELINELYARARKSKEITVR